MTHPVTRTVFESAPVPGLGQQQAPAAHYSFYVDRMDSNCHVPHAPDSRGARQPGRAWHSTGSSASERKCSWPRSQFIEKPFADDAAAKSWLAGDEGQAIKALLLSVTYR